MNNFKNIEQLLLNIIKENEVEVGIDSSEFQTLIENNIDTHYSSKETIGTKFFIDNEDLKIFSNEILLFFNILQYQKDDFDFESYMSEAKRYVEAEVEKFANVILDSEDDVKREIKELDKIDVNAYLIVNNFEELIKVGDRFKKPIIKKIEGLKFIIHIIARTLPLDHTIEPEIKIDSRLESIKLINQDEELKGYIFTANLFDVTKLYKEIGHDLFISNLRIGIKDQNNVDDSIKETILKDHNNFWYYNNGITLIVKEENINFENPDRLILKYGGLKDFTIVNGAQTVTSASNIFFGTNEKFIEKESHIKDQAKVLLRVIMVPNKQTLKTQDLVSKIAISLNRQKPITQEDIAYVVKFIEVINYIHESEKSSYSFRIVRRGEGESLGTNEFELLTIARVVKAYLAAAPGPARSLGKKTLLNTKTTNNNVSFSQDDVFLHPEIYNDEDRFKKYKETFNKYYKPVSFGVSIKFKLEKLASGFEKIKYSTIPNLTEIYESEPFNALKEEVFTVNGEVSEGVNDVVMRMIDTPVKEETIKSINYGKYHLITFIINYLSGNDQLKSKSDFTSWKNPSPFTEEKLYNHAQVFSLAWKLASIKSNKEKTLSFSNFDFVVFIASSFDSNLFKNSRITDNNATNNHLNATYRFYLNFIELYKKHNTEVKF